MSSMSKMMKKMAMVENLMAKRPSGSATGSFPHSNGSSLTRESRLGAINAGMPSKAPATSAATANTMRIEMYSMVTARARRPRPSPAGIGAWRGTRSAPAARPRHGRTPWPGPPRPAGRTPRDGSTARWADAGGTAADTAQGQDVHVDRLQIAHCRQQLIVLLAEPEDD